MSPGTYAIADLIASVLAADHFSFFNAKPAVAKGIFTQRSYRSFGLAEHLGWARLLTDRYRVLSESRPNPPEPDGHRDLTSDGGDAFGYGIYHSPDTHSNEN